MPPHTIALVMAVVVMLLPLLVRGIAELADWLEQRFPLHDSEQQ